MLSDEWLRAGYIKDAKVWILSEHLINYEIWRDHSGELKGLTLNFEYADDYHIELCYSNWLRLSEILKWDIGAASQPKQILEDYFKSHNGVHFEFLLKEYQIAYDIIRFY